jgi:endonuclease YncB( thermonuclease family)
MMPVWRASRTAALLGATVLVTACIPGFQGLTLSATTLHCADCPAIPVYRVIDGDTFQSGDETVRLYGVDTPERGEPCYAAATDRLRKLAGESVRVESGPRAEDRFGRSLYYTYRMDGESIDEMLVREGLAQAWTRDGQHRDVLLAVESRAEEHERGC